jgi:hypothetical protein
MMKIRGGWSLKYEGLGDMVEITWTIFEAECQVREHRQESFIILSTGETCPAPGITAKRYVSA